MVEKELHINNASNHEFELATLIVQQASQFDSMIRIIMDDKQVNAKSIMGMTYLSLMDGDTVTVTCSGQDEQKALVALQELLEK
ncbi:MAG TPA: HPr family phosphocarrier protein [Lachnospiraceae bacterium]|jgi:phosphocarrier protein HPr|nr:HPr family phosphocarrier protein [Lachnospiraceae bacterium]